MRVAAAAEPSAPAGAVPPEEGAALGSAGDEAEPSAPAGAEPPEDAVPDAPAGAEPPEDAVPDEPDSMQWRFTWLGCVDDEEENNCISVDMRRNGGVVAMATIGAPSARRHIWPSAVVLDAKSQLVVFANERLVERFEKSACRNYLTGMPHDAPILVSCLVCTVVVHKASALAGQRRICVMAVSVTYAEREQHLQRGLPRLSEGDFSDVREVLAEFIMNHKEEQPR
ncbi:MAG: hypothetical protein GY772_33005, partial [bacterium]|nr:hypothetical protein [bacterium]